MGVRPFVIRLDAIIRRRRGVFTFSTDEDCLLRLELGKAPHALCLDGRTVEEGDPVLFLHLWNEHLPPLPASGPTVAWAKRAERLFFHSLRRAAEEIRRDPRFGAVRAVGGMTAVFPPDPGSSGARFLGRLGFVVLPYHGRLGRFGEFWENLYSLWLIRAYNPAGLHGRRASRLRRSEIWMPIEDFLAEFAGERRGYPPSPVRPVPEGSPEPLRRPEGRRYNMGSPSGYPESVLRAVGPSQTVAAVFRPPLVWIPILPIWHRSPVGVGEGDGDGKETDHKRG